MLTGEEKGALLLKHLDPGVAETVLAQLGPNRGSRLRAVMEHLKSSPAMVDELLGEIAGVLNVGPPKLAIAQEAPAPPLSAAAPPVPKLAAPEQQLTPELIEEL